MTWPVWRNDLEPIPNSFGKRDEIPAVVSHRVKAQDRSTLSHPPDAKSRFAQRNLSM
jgi:hypothetical protein